MMGMGFFFFFFWGGGWGGGGWGFKLFSNSWFNLCVGRDIFFNNTPCMHWEGSCWFLFCFCFFSSCIVGGKIRLKFVLCGLQCNLTEFLDSHKWV